MQGVAASGICVHVHCEQQTGDGAAGPASLACELGAAARSTRMWRPSTSFMFITTAFTAAASVQGLTLVHFSAQRERFEWDRGAFRGCSGGVKGNYGVCRLHFVSETAQVELKCGRV
jgi:hypothetical protein